DARLIVHHQDAMDIAAAGERADGGRCGSRTLRVQPGFDIAFAKTPLTADTNGRDLARLDQAIDGPEVDVQVLQDLFGGQENVVAAKVLVQNGAHFTLSPARIGEP